jgi:hypothetical protein
LYQGAAGKINAEPGTAMQDQRQNANGNTNDRQEKGDLFFADKVNVDVRFDKPHEAFSFNMCIAQMRSAVS